MRYFEINYKIQILMLFFKNFKIIFLEFFNVGFAVHG